MKTIILTIIFGMGICFSSAAAPTPLVDWVADFEGFRSDPYDDGPQFAVGHGIAVGWLQARKLPSRNVTRRDARFALRVRLAEDKQELCKLIPGFDQLNSEVQYSLRSAYFNCQALIGPNLQRFISQQDWDAASKELALGHDPDGKYGLVKRRFAEANRIRSACGLSKLATPNNMNQFDYLKRLWKQGRF